MQDLPIALLIILVVILYPYYRDRKLNKTFEEIEQKDIMQDIKELDEPDNTEYFNYKIEVKGEEHKDE